MLPQDDRILLSVINTKLRDEFDSLSDLCEAMDVSEEEIKKRLCAAGYVYDAEKNRFL